MDPEIVKEPNRLLFNIIIGVSVGIFLFVCGILTGKGTKK